MNKDARKRPKAEQQSIRKQAVVMSKTGIKNRKIAAISGVHVVTVQGWLRKYKAIGSKLWQSDKRGCPPGRGAILTAKQHKKLAKSIIDTTPEQLKLPFCLWTRRAIVDAVQHLYGKKVALRTVTDWMKKWKFTVQKPLRKAYRQNPKLVKKWLKKEYPSIKKLALKEGAEIHWGDQTGLQSRPNTARGFAPRGQTPEIKDHGSHFGISMISSITNKGTARFMFYQEKMNSQLFIKFMQRLCKDNQQKIFFIVDNLKVHHSKIVKQWEKENKSKIKLFYLPAYAPELNPDERLNRDLKGQISRKSPPKNKKQMLGCVD